MSPPPLRILTFLHSFELGGVERVALRLCRTWVAGGVDNCLIMGNDAGPLRAEAEGLGYQVLSRDSAPGALRMIQYLPAIIRRERPDVLFCAGNTYSIVAVAMKLMLGRDCPPIVAKISNDLARSDMPQPMRWFYHRWLRIQARFIDRFVGMAPPMRAEIAQAMRIDASSVAIIDDPALALADIERLSQRAADPQQRTRFVAAGRLAPQKNFPLLLRAFATIARDDDTLTILGDGPGRIELERLCKELGIAACVRMPGHVPDLAPWFVQSDIFALSSDFEGVPAVIAEALAAGLAIVATDCSVSMGDMLGGGTLGLLTPPGNAEAFAGALDASRTLAIDRTAMRTQAERFTVETAAGRYLEVFAAVRKSSAFY